MQVSYDDRPMGWEPDEPRALPGYEDLFGVDTPQPYGSMTREPWTDLYQIKKSCCSHGASYAEYAFTGIKTSPYPRHYAALAEKYPYQAADKDAILPDEGLSFGQILDSFQNSGACEYKFWNPETPGFDPCKRPPWSARVDSQRHNLTVSIVLGTGDELFAALAVAQDRGHFPLIALDVDPAFADFTGNGIIGAQSGPTLGGHLVPMVSHKFHDGEATIGNYWRPRLISGVWIPWGTGNLARISRARIAEARAGFVVHEVG